MPNIVEYYMWSWKCCVFFKENKNSDTFKINFFYNINLWGRKMRFQGLLKFTTNYFWTEQRSWNSIVDVIFSLINSTLLKWLEIPLQEWKYHILEKKHYQSWQTLPKVCLKINSFDPLASHPNFGCTSSFVVISDTYVIFYIPRREKFPMISWLIFGDWFFV